jgi:hypothetical protein
METATLMEWTISSGPATTATIQPTTRRARRANGDFNNDTVDDGRDDLVWASNYGQGPNDGVTVPEPSSLRLAAVGLLMIIGQRRAGRR